MVSPWIIGIEATSPCDLSWLYLVVLFPPFAYKDLYQLVRLVKVTNIFSPPFKIRFFSPFFCFKEILRSIHYAHYSFTSQNLTLIVGGGMGKVKTCDAINSGKSLCSHHNNTSLIKNIPI